MTTIDAKILHAAASVLGKDPHARSYSTKVRIERYDERLHIVSTDGQMLTSYTMLCDPEPDLPTATSANFSAATIKTLPKKGEVTLSWTDKPTLTHKSGVQIYAEADNEYPSWRQVVAKLLASKEPTSPAMFNPQLLAKLHKAGCQALGLKTDDHTFTMLQRQEDVVVLWWPHSHWIGILMPLKYAPADNAEHLLSYIND